MGTMRVPSFDVPWAAFCDHEMLASLSCGFASFASVALSCFALERCRAFRRFRAQPYKPNEGRLTNAEWWEALRVSAWNALVVHWPVNVVAFWLYRNVIGHGTELTITSVVGQLAFCLLFVEVWFYTSHIALHSKLLYRRVHKTHHRFTYPSAVCALYAHWFEFVVGNQLGVVLGPVLIGCHPYVTRAWLALALGGTALAHSGFVVATAAGNLFDASHHDLHHEFFHCNYGVLGLCDWLLRTDASYRGYIDAKAEKRNVPSHGGGA